MSRLLLLVSLPAVLGLGCLPQATRTAGGGPARQPPDTKVTSAPELPTVAEVEATVTAVSKPRPPRRLGVYRDGFFVVHYSISNVVSGRLQARAIQAVHQSVRDLKVTPAAAIGPGEVHRLTLAGWDAASAYYGQFAIDDDFVDIETPMYFVKAWSPCGSGG
jgi:hypothetical protein